MESRALRPGDLVEVDIKGLLFEATVRCKSPGLVGIDPIDPHHTWRNVSPRRVRRVLERRGVAA